MLEWLIIGAILILIIYWVRQQSKRPCSGCDGCTANCSLNKNISQNEVHQDEN
ncbi:MAG TPA: FeoB-associated Cys-rich membrane protein [Bacillota bacterium]|nr:FeoB-associated Cys-rich membrane protein [Bacillota bacterium]